jgi:hypothetical protein
MSAETNPQKSDLVRHSRTASLFPRPFCVSKLLAGNIGGKQGDYRIRELSRTPRRRANADIRKYRPVR